MLRFIAWRFLFEISNVKRIFGRGSGQVQYLAFGANLSDAVLKQRQIRPVAMTHFTLRDYGLRFDHPSPWLGSGFASAEPASGELLYGYLYTLSHRDAQRMDFFEVVPVLNRYRRHYVEQDGVSLYFYQTCRPTPNLKPTGEYLGFITAGLETHPQATSAYCKLLAATETAEPVGLTKSYLWQQPEGRAAWLHSLIGWYQQLTLKIFLSTLYNRSLTSRFIRH
ncbi:MAG: gamma-glutamylcyclotransferase [Gammaproteobacteria bacterium]|nr:gamma-glutamylcyclotransferase [Gammaproteobacteria bacterium]